MEGCKHALGCHACVENIDSLVRFLNQFLAVKDKKNLEELCGEAKSLRDWILVQWGIEKQEALCSHGLGSKP